MDGIPKLCLCTFTEVLMQTLVESFCCNPLGKGLTVYHLSFRMGLKTGDKKKKIKKKKGVEKTATGVNKKHSENADTSMSVTFDLEV